MALLGMLGMGFDKYTFADFDKAPDLEAGEMLTMKVIDGRWHYTVDDGLSWVYMDKREPK